MAQCAIFRPLHFTTVLWDETSRSQSVVYVSEERAACMFRVNEASTLFRVDENSIVLKVGGGSTLPRVDQDSTFFSADGYSMFPQNACKCLPVYTKSYSSNLHSHCREKSLNPSFILMARKYKYNFENRKPRVSKRKVTQQSYQPLLFLFQFVMARSAVSSATLTIPPQHCNNLRDDAMS